MLADEKCFYNEAIGKIQIGNFNEAVKPLERHLHDFPDHGDALHLLGVCFLKIHRLERAMACLKKATTITPNNARFQYHYGLSLIQLEIIEEAIEAFRLAVMADEAFDDARYNLAKALKDKGCYDEAIFEYEHLVRRRPDHTDALYNLGNVYLEQGDNKKASICFENVLKAEPGHASARINLALVHGQSGRRNQAREALELVIDAEPGNEVARKHLQKLNSRLVPAWHFDMLNDDVRNQDYDHAIRRVAAKAEHVLEIGTGSGLLAMMAARAGAKRVTTCEMNASLARCAQRIIVANGYEDRIRVLAKKSTSLRIGEDIPGRADVLIAEVFDLGLIGEHFLPALIHAKQNLLKDDAVILPAAANIRGILVQCPSLRNVNPIGTIAGFDLSEFNVFHSPGYRQFDMQANEYRPLSSPFDIVKFDFQKNIRLSQTIQIDVGCSESGNLQAIVFWFELVLAPDVLFSSKHSRKGNHWKQAIYFFPQDHRIKKDQTVRLEVKQDKADLSFAVTLHGGA